MRIVRILIALALLAGALFAAVLAIGATLPRTHVVSRYAVLNAPADSVWAAIADLDHLPTWWPGVQRMERLPDRDGHPVWREVTPGGSWPLAITEAIAPVRLVAEVADTTQGFGGTWTYSLAPEGAGVRVTVVERGFVDPPLMRFLSRYVLRPQHTMDAYLVGLGRRFRQRVVPRDAGVTS